MTNVKDARRTATTIKIRSDSSSRITRSRNPYFELMKRLFQDEQTAMRGQKFLMMVEDRQKEGRPIKTGEWEELVKELKVSRSSFYAMRNKLLGAGLITTRGGEYRLSGEFSKDLADMSRWWWTAVLGNKPENL